MCLLIILTLVVAVILGLVFLKRQQPAPSANSKPPGPKQLPVIGNLLDIKDPERVHLSFFDWAKEYGPLFSCKILKVDALVINRPELVRKAFSSEKYINVFSDRPPTFIGRHVAYNYMDVIFARYSKSSVEMRKIVKQALLKYGDGTDLFKPRTQAEVRRVLEVVGATNGEDFNPRPVLERSVAELMSQMLVGTGVSDELYKPIETFQLHVNTLVSPSNELTLFNFPFLRFIPGKFGSLYKTVVDSRDKLEEYFYTKQQYTYSSYTERGLIDMLFKAKEDNQDLLTEENIQGIIVDVLGAASITLANATLSALLMLLNNPECQERLFSEIEKVVGTSRAPVLTDMDSLPYAMAVIYESLRVSTHVPIVFPHYAMENTVFEEYYIPKDTWVFANLWQIHHDEKMFPNPWDFNPDRILDSNGRLISPDDPIRQSIMPFSNGIRMCLGENTVKARLFLYLTALVQNFKLLPPVDGVLPKADPRNYQPGIILKPMPFNFRAVMRQ